MSIPSHLRFYLRSELLFQNSNFNVGASKIKVGKGPPTLPTFSSDPVQNDISDVETWEYCRLLLLILAQVIAKASVVLHML